MRADGPWSRSTERTGYNDGRGYGVPGRRECRSWNDHHNVAGICDCEWNGGGSRVDECGIRTERSAKSELSTERRSDSGGRVLLGRIPTWGWPGKDGNMDGPDDVAYKPGGGT